MREFSVEPAGARAGGAKVDMRLLLLASGVLILFLFYLSLYKPSRLKGVVRYVRIVGFAWVAAIIIGSIIRLFWPELYGVMPE